MLSTKHKEEPLILYLRLFGSIAVALGGESVAAGVEGRNPTLVRSYGKRETDKKNVTRWGNEEETRKNESNGG